jgi:hypothetical protein
MSDASKVWHWDMILSLDSVYLSPGPHSIWVRWYDSEDTYPSGRIDFEHVYTFESGVYDLTGEKEGEKGLFGLKKR